MVVINLNDARFGGLSDLSVAMRVHPRPACFLMLGYWNHNG
jgi:hypothetical protein